MSWSIKMFAVPLPLFKFQFIGYMNNMFLGKYQMSAPEHKYKFQTSKNPNPLDHCTFQEHADSKVCNSIKESCFLLRFLNLGVRMLLKGTVN